MDNSPTAFEWGSPQPETIDFHGEEISVFPGRDDDHVYVVVKDICDHLGINSWAQIRRIKEDEVLAKASRYIAVSSEFGVKQTFCLALSMLDAWLFSIGPNEVGKGKSPEVRQSLREKNILYRRECARALHAHFFGRHGVNPSAPQISALLPERVPLLQAQSPSQTSPPASNENDADDDATLRLRAELFIQNGGWGEMWADRTPEPSTTAFDQIILQCDQLVLDVDALRSAQRLQASKIDDIIARLILIAHRLDQPREDGEDPELVAPTKPRSPIRPRAQGCTCGPRPLGLFPKHRRQPLPCPLHQPDLPGL
jgi:hypothetical protein